MTEFFRPTPVDPIAWLEEIEYRLDGLEDRIVELVAALHAIREVLTREI